VLATTTQLKFIAPERLIEGWDVSRSFLWRLEKAKLIAPFYLYSRKLYRLEDVQRLEGMIERGELRAALRGAAKAQGTTA
jgi:hypothetical protein